MDAAIIWTWAKPIPGHEKDAIAYWYEVTEHFTKLADEGRCTPMEVFMSGSAPFDMAIVKGEHMALFELAHTEEFAVLADKGMMLLANFRYWFYETGDALGLVATEYIEAANELTHVS